MNYEKHYKLLCQTRQQLNRQKLPASHPDYVYYELHHIVPRHEAGSDEASNLVLLTAREHFIAHWLFAKWKRTTKAWAALSIFIRKSYNGRSLTSRQYEICRIANAIAHRGRTDSSETTMRRRASAKARGPRSPATRQKISIANLGKKDTIGTRKKKSNSRLGLKHSIATREKQSKNGGHRAGYKCSAEEKFKHSYASFKRMQTKYGYCKLCSKENFLALEAYLQYA